MTQQEAAPAPFEDSLKQLEKLVTQLEEGGLGLDESITLYEQGMKLASECRESLDRAELKINTLRETYLREDPVAYDVDADPEDV